MQHTLNFLTEFAPLVLAAIAVFGAYEKWKSNKQAKYRKWFDDKIEKILANYTTIEKNDSDNQIINAELTQIKKELEIHNKHFVQYQMRSLATEIIRYAEDLRRGLPKSKNSFQHITDSYEKYKLLGGNRYIDEEWVYIKKAMKNELH